MSTIETDVLVIGSGIAGLLAAAEACDGNRVVLVTKSALEESNTRYAQGGIAAVLSDTDDIESHVADTVAAGAGLCDEDAVRVLCTEGPACVQHLIDLGVAFDRDGDVLAFGREGAHGRARVLHAGGDATGAMVEAALAAAVRDRDVTVEEHLTLVDVIVDHARATGARFTSTTGEVQEIRAASVILATGGAGQVWSHTTNPAVATGDGVAAAFRAGAVVRDAELYQFHPTALALPGEPFLISEAVRGEGAVLRNARGEAFMADQHPLADLAPRDVVARAIATEMARQDGQPVVIDATALSLAFLAERFPNIDRRCRERGIEWSETPVPVTPAAHYWMGGVATDIDGRTTVPGLYAIGEVASTGVHGANRLASNSLLEGIVFARRAVAAINAGTSTSPDYASSPLPLVAGTSSPCQVSEIQQLMWDQAGLVRDEAGLAVAAKTLAGCARDDPASKNLLVVARLIVEGALMRRESRGAHFRSDFPISEDQYVRHIGWSSC